MLRKCSVWQLAIDEITEYTKLYMFFEKIKTLCYSGRTVALRRRLSNHYDRKIHKKLSAIGSGVTGTNFYVTVFCVSKDPEGWRS